MSWEYRVPPGVEAFLPDSAGYPCKPGWWSGDTLEVVTHVSAATFRTRRPGTATVHCPKSTIRITVEELARLELTGPEHVEVNPLIDAEFQFQGYGTSGQPLDLDIVFEPDETWSAPPSIEFRYPRCGHIAPLCSGASGRGDSIQVRPHEPGRVEIGISFMGKTASRPLLVEPKAEGTH